MELVSIGNQYLLEKINVIDFTNIGEKANESSHTSIAIVIIFKPQSERLKYQSFK
jgi:hypothetical protein